MKVEYIKPSMRVIEIRMSTFICLSNNRLYLPKKNSSPGEPGQEDFEDDVDFE
jgi:hypothetical protein